MYSAARSSEGFSQEAKLDSNMLVNFQNGTKQYVAKNGHYYLAPKDHQSVVVV